MLNKWVANWNNRNQSVPWYHSLIILVKLYSNWSLCLRQSCQQRILHAMWLDNFLVSSGFVSLIETQIKTIWCPNLLSNFWCFLNWLNPVFDANRVVRYLLASWNVTIKPNRGHYKHSDDLFFKNEIGVPFNAAESLKV